MLDVTMDGVPRDAQARFETSLEEGLRGAGLEVLPRARVAEAVERGDTPPGCTFGDCLKAVGKTLATRLALVARVTARGPSFTFVLTLVDMGTGYPVSQVSDTCAVCTFDEAIAAATLAVVELATAAPPASPPPGDGARRARSTRRTAWWMTGLAVVGVAVGAYLVSTDEDQAGWASIGAGGGFGIAGITLFAISQ